MALDQDYYNIGNWLAQKLKAYRIAQYRHIKNKQINIGEIWKCELGYNIGDEKNKCF